MLEKIEVHASSKHIKFRVESCKSLSHLNSFRFMLFSLCLGWYPANLCLLWNYRMDFSPIYIMFAAFSRDVQSVLVLCIQLSSDIVSDTFVVTFPFMYTLFIYFDSKKELLNTRSLVNVSACNWPIWVNLVLIKIVSGDTNWRTIRLCLQIHLKYSNRNVCSVHAWNRYIYVVFFCFSFFFNIPPLMISLLKLI